MTSCLSITLFLVAISPQPSATIHATTEQAESALLDEVMSSFFERGHTSLDEAIESIAGRSETRDRVDIEPVAVTADFHTRDGGREEEDVVEAPQLLESFMDPLNIDSGNAMQSSKSAVAVDTVDEDTADDRVSSPEDRAADVKEANSLGDDVVSDVGQAVSSPLESTSSLLGADVEIVEDEMRPVSVREIDSAFGGVVDSMVTDTQEVIDREGEDTADDRVSSPEDRAADGKEALALSFGELATIPVEAAQQDLGKVFESSSRLEGMDKVKEELGEERPVLPPPELASNLREVDVEIVEDGLQPTNVSAAEAVVGGLVGSAPTDTLEAIDGEGEELGEEQTALLPPGTTSSLLEGDVEVVEDALQPTNVQAAETVFGGLVESARTDTWEAIDGEGEEQAVSSLIESASSLLGAEVEIVEDEMRPESVRETDSAFSGVVESARMDTREVIDSEAEETADGRGFSAQNRAADGKEANSLADDAVSNVGEADIDIVQEELQPLAGSLADIAFGVVSENIGAATPDAIGSQFEEMVTDSASSEEGHAADGKQAESRADSKQASSGKALDVGKDQDLSCTVEDFGDDVTDGTSAGESETEKTYETAGKAADVDQSTEHNMGDDENESNGAKVDVNVKTTAFARQIDQDNTFESAETTVARGGDDDGGVSGSKTIDTKDRDDDEDDGSNDGMIVGREVDGDIGDSLANLEGEDKDDRENVHDIADDEGSLRGGEVSKEHNDGVEDDEDDDDKEIDGVVDDDGSNDQMRAENGEGEDDSDVGFDVAEDEINLPDEAVSKLHIDEGVVPSQADDAGDDNVYADDGDGQDVEQAVDLDVWTDDESDEDEDDSGGAFDEAEDGKCFLEEGMSEESTDDKGGVADEPYSEEEDDAFADSDEDPDVGSDEDGKVQVDIEDEDVDEDQDEDDSDEVFDETEHDSNFLGWATKNIDDVVVVDEADDADNDDDVYDGAENDSEDGEDGDDEGGELDADSEDKDDSEDAIDEAEDDSSSLAEVGESIDDGVVADEAESVKEHDEDGDDEDVKEVVDSDDEDYSDEAYDDTEVGSNSLRGIRDRIDKVIVAADADDADEDDDVYDDSNEEGNGVDGEEDADSDEKDDSDDALDETEDGSNSLAEARESINDGIVADESDDVDNDDDVDDDSDTDSEDADDEGGDQGADGKDKDDSDDSDDAFDETEDDGNSRAEVRESNDDDVVADEADGAKEHDDAYDDSDTELDDGDDEDVEEDADSKDEDDSDEAFDADDADEDHDVYDDSDEDSEEGDGEDVGEDADSEDEDDSDEAFDADDADEDDDVYDDSDEDSEEGDGEDVEEDADSENEDDSDEAFDADDADEDDDVYDDSGEDSQGGDGEDGEEGADSEDKDDSDDAFDEIEGSGNSLAEVGESTEDGIVADEADGADEDDVYEESDEDSEDDDDEEGEEDDSDSTFNEAEADDGIHLFEDGISEESTSDMSDVADEADDADEDVDINIDSDDVAEDGEVEDNEADELDALQDRLEDLSASLKATLDGINAMESDSIASEADTADEEGDIEDEEEDSE
eukprot:TRINITY_DN4230_c0_g1_i2.p1 TRINITY_DN4230_c0_g1~~TRINITY_DN4230_c0_g1_i2.p1  ORF type:complete len:1562 (+),score=587.59 TRINITY_DN4230_c0_g1_i2:31-4686(+)